MVSAYRKVGMDQACYFTGGWTTVEALGVATGADWAVLATVAAVDFVEAHAVEVEVAAVMIAAAALMASVCGVGGSRAAAATMSCAAFSISARLRSERQPVNIKTDSNMMVSLMAPFP